MSQSTNITDVLSKERIYFNKYKILSSLGQGSFGKCCLSYDINTNEKFCMKIENKKNEQLFLEIESYILVLLKGGKGFPNLISYGSTDNYNILIMELLGKTLEKLFEEEKQKLSLKTVCMVTMQMINRLEFLHSKCLIHRDIKPENLLFGIEENRKTLYLIDFGLAKRYKNSKTNEHIKYFNNNKLTGTARYASVNALNGFEQSRRDDLEGLCYVMVYLLKGNLPWQGIKTTKKIKKYKMIYQMKKNITPEELIGNKLPYDLVKFIKYCKNLGFEEDPNYNYLRGLIRNIMNKNCIQFDFIYDWDMHNIKNGVHHKKNYFLLKGNDDIIVENSKEISDEEDNNSLSENIDDESLNINKDLIHKIDEYCIFKPIEESNYKFISDLKNKYKRNRNKRKIIDINHNKELTEDIEEQKTDEYISKANTLTPTKFYKTNMFIKENSKKYCSNEIKKEKNKINYNNLDYNNNEQNKSNQKLVLKFSKNEKDITRRVNSNIELEKNEDCIIF